MKFLFLTLLFFTLSITFIFSSKQEVVHSPISSKVLPRQNSNIHPSKSFPRLTNGNLDSLILWQDDFENGAENWLIGDGWELTEISSNSPIHSMVSPNDNNNLGGSFNLLTPFLELPEIGVNETMHFGFWLHADMPDSDGDGDDYLDDYYSISLLDLGALAWHSTDLNSSMMGSAGGNNFWSGDEEINGYLDSWIQYLDTPSISVGSGGNLSAKIYYAIESPDDVEVEGSCTDGWDAANIRISNDGGATWVLLEDESNPYHFDCGYGWIWNDAEYESGGSLHQLASGWGGDSNSWLDFSADLNGFENEEIVIRFAFGSDPAWSTVDDYTLTGFQVDGIIIIDDSGELFRDDGNDMSQMTASGEVWINQFYDYGSIAEGRPGADDWEVYLPGMSFNGNVFLDISDFAEKTVQFRIQSSYDDNHDGGQGGGLFIDDFMIYKLSSGAYFPPWGLNAEAGNGEVVLTWEDMNASGTEDFIYDNGVFELENTLYISSAWVGEWFDVIGPSTINIIKIFNSISNLDTTITIQAYGMYGSTFDIDPLHSILADVSLGWNEIPVDWDMNNLFIIAYEINGTFGGALDTTAFNNRSVINYGGTWKNLRDTFEPAIIAEFGLRANITYEGAGVSYNIYRDDLQIRSGLMENFFTDNDVVNNTTYEYTVSATYDDGEESGQSSSIIVTPLASTIHQESHDDGSFESEFIAGSGNFSAVKYSANALGESIMRFKWYQIGSGGAFYIKVFDDDGGIPGSEIYSAVQASGSNVDGWNEKDLSEWNIMVYNDFWIGIKEFSSSQPFGLDTTSVTGFSFKRTGTDGDWIAINGNLGYRIFLDVGECYYDCAGVCGGDAIEDECGICGGEGPSSGYDCNGNCIVGLDCAGICGGGSVEDECGVCEGDGPLGPDGQPNSNYNCLGECTAGVDCNGQCGGTLLGTGDGIGNDACGVCEGAGPAENYNCLGECTAGVDCNGQCGGTFLGTGDGIGNDECGVCEGDGPLGPDGQPNSNYNCLGECTAGVDCNGQCGGDAAEDACGICDGTIIVVSECGAGCTTEEADNLNKYGLDCNGQCGGSAVEDECGVCAGSGSSENYNCEGECTAGVDCNGQCGGTLLGTGDGIGNDVCGICGGSGPPENYNCALQCIAGVDCNALCGGPLLNICIGFETNMQDSCLANDGFWSELGNDECGVCEGDGPLGPDGQPNSNYNCLGECTAGVDCNGQCGGTLLGTGDGIGNDECGECGGLGPDEGFDCDGDLAIINPGLIPKTYNIHNIYPNPFNPIANIQFDVAEFSQVKLSIIDLNGRLVSVLENEKMNPGQYQSLWDGNDSHGNQVSSGIYLAVFESNGMLLQTRKLVLLK